MEELNKDKSFTVRLLLWLLSLSFVYISVSLLAFLGREGWDLDEIVFQTGITLITFGMLVYTASPKRFAWGLRLITFVIFLAFLGYLFNQFIIQQSSFNVAMSRTSPTPFNALLGFLIIGIPCLMYSLWGSIWGAQKTRSGTEGNSLSYWIALTAQWVFLLLSLLSIVYYFLF